jgi:ribosomal protein L16/L10AE
MTPKTLFYLSLVNKEMYEEANQDQHWKIAYLRKHPYSKISTEGAKAEFFKLYMYTKQQQQIERDRIKIVRQMHETS